MAETPPNPAFEVPFETLVDIEIEHDGWLAALPDIDRVVTRSVEAALGHMQFAGQADVVVLMTDDAEMQALNREHRKKNAPTNVLSFPAPEFQGSGAFSGHLGDIAMGFETCVREAREQNKSLKDHVAHLTVHSVLHLLGYDHMTDQEAHEMEDLERAILKPLGVSDPYIADED